jgi:hypothetical protein
MYQLNEQQISWIENDLKKKGLQLEELRLNILDHICCILENELKDDGNLENEYEKILARFYKKELKEIEDETQLLLTYKHYYAMKKTMLTSGIISMIGFVTGGLLKFFFLPGAGIFFIVGFMFFALLFLPLLMLLKMREPKSDNNLLLVLATTAGCSAVIGALFKIMHWPFANMLMNIGFLLFTFVFIPIYFFSGRKEESKRFTVSINTVLFVGASGILFSLVNLRSSYVYDRALVQADSLLRQNIILSDGMIQKQYSKDSTVKKIELEKMIDEALLMSEKIIEKIRIAQSGGENAVDIREISTSTQFGVVEEILFTAKEKDKSAITNWRNQLEKIEKSALENGINITLVTDRPDSETGNNILWEEDLFRNNPVNICVRKIQLIELELKLLKAKQ